MHTVCDYEDKEPNKTTTVRSDNGKERVEVKSCLSNNSSSTNTKRNEEEL